MYSKCSNYLALYILFLRTCLFHTFVISLLQVCLQCLILFNNVVVHTQIFLKYLKYMLSQYSQMNILNNLPTIYPRPTKSFLYNTTLKQWHHCQMIHHCQWRTTINWETTGNNTTINDTPPSMPYDCQWHTTGGN